MSYTPLSNINPSTRQWTICVRISHRLHYRRGTDTGPIDHTDLVLLDQQGNHMYGEISIDNVSRFEPLLHEGRIYELRKFIVSPVETSFKHVRGPYMVWFTRHTIVEEKVDVSDNFPMWTYNLIPFTQIPNPTSAPEHFVGRYYYSYASSSLLFLHMSYHVLLSDITSCHNSLLYDRCYRC